jgi:hypothetical protein
MGKTKDPGKKTIQHFRTLRNRQIHGTVINQIKERFSKKNEEKSKRTDEEEKRLNEVGLELAKKFSYSKLSVAVDGRGGYEVHGYMQKTYIDYQWLINNFVLDRACFYAKRDYTPEIIKFLREVDIKSYHRSVVETPHEIFFENYPQFPFSKVIIYSREPLEKAINWIDEYPWELDGYDTNVNLGPANVGLIGWATWNIPVLLVLHAPGKNKAFFEAKISSKSLRDEHVEQLKSFIYQFRTYINVIEEKISELEMESMQYQKLYSDLKRTVLTNSPISSEEEFRKFEKSKGSTSSFKANKKTVLWSLLIIVLMIVIFVLIFIVTNTMITLSNFTNSTSTSNLSILNDILLR